MSQPYNGQPQPQPYGAPHGAPYGPSYGGPGQGGGPGQYPLQRFPVRQPPTSTTGPKIMTFIGAGLLVVALITLAIGLQQVTRGLADSSLAIAHSRAPGPLEFDAEAGRSYALVVTSTSARQIRMSDVTVVGPDGATATLSTTSFNASSSSSTSQTTSDAATFTTAESGKHTVSLNGTSTDAPGSLAILDASQLAGYLGGLAISALLIIGSSIVAFTAGLLALAGGIWWGVRHSAGKRSTPGAPVGPYGPPTHGYHSP